jgi:hypothetical protein
MSVKKGVLHGFERINWFEPHVVFLPTEACAVIRSLLSHRRIFRRYNFVVKTSFAEKLMASASALRGRMVAHDVAIDAIMLKEAGDKARRDRRTRASELEFHFLYSRAKEKRQRCWVEEEHMNFSVLEDVHRTLGELNTAVLEFSQLEKKGKQNNL